MNINKKAITIVELIVVVTILAILATVSFLWFKSYTVYSRDTVRLTDLKNMKSVLEYTYTESSNYPLPENGTWVTFSGWLVWTQWIFWEKTKRATKRLDVAPVDPLTKNHYTYSVLNKWDQYELWAIMEWWEVSSNKIIEESYAASGFKWYITWNYNWKIAKVVVWNTEYILAVPSIINWDMSYDRLEDIISNQSLSMIGFDNIPDSYWVNNPNDVVFVNRWSFVVFSWSTETLSGSVAQESFLENLQNAYSWTVIEDSWDISDIINVTEDNEDIFTQTIINEEVNDDIPVTATTTSEPEESESNSNNCTFPFIFPCIFQ